jgi:hypothetical protein
MKRGMKNNEKIRVKRERKLIIKKRTCQRKKDRKEEQQMKRKTKGKN